MFAFFGASSVKYSTIHCTRASTPITDMSSQQTDHSVHLRDQITFLTEIKINEGSPDKRAI